jgi:hypothetical protein
MTSGTNARELERLRTARGQAHHRFARQLNLLTQIEASAAELERLTTRWHGQLAALVELAGGTGPAAELTGLPKTRLEAAARAVARPDVDAALAAAVPGRRRRPPEGADGSSATDRDGRR